MNTASRRGQAIKGILVAAAALGLVALVPEFRLTAQTSPHGKLAVPCEQCHTANSWKEMLSPAKFNHAKTRFPLKGQHSVVACRQCHTTLTFSGAATQCKDCHKDVHRGELGMSCDRCHGSQSWLVPDMVQRHTQTRFSLLGAHMTAACEACHINQQKNEYVGVRTECVSCHLPEYQATVAPPHRASGLGTDCVQCHSISSLQWHGSFDHATSQFPLTGAHQSIPCSQCHVGNRFRGTPTQCVSCHQKDYTNTANPKHVPGFSTDCVGCHRTVAWRPATFDHSRANFKLTGAHVATPCLSCHVNGVYAGTPQQCFVCHQKDFTNTINPKHSPGFSTDCVGCHGTAVWRPATFDHSKANFILTGAHVATPCLSCHVNGVYTGTPQQCYTCHQKDYTNTTNPKHSPGFPTDCVGCHGTAVWRPATFDHSKASFKLTGAHVQTPCASCHVNGVYTGTPQQCASCHLSRYNATTNPAHAPAGFPTDCQPCHSTTAWTPSTFQHDPFFPISAGSKHSPGRWSVCADCHTVATNFKTFSCITCHQHASTIVNPKHSGVANYRYDSQACYSCHPRGAG